MDRDRLLYGHIPEERDYGRRVSSDQEGHRVIRDLLRVARPCLITRLGASEARVTDFYLRWRSRVPLSNLRPPYPSRNVQEIATNAGFFPDDATSIDRFAALYLDSAGAADILGVWFLPNEHVLARQCPNARLVHLRCLDPILYPEPWTSELEGRRVLVVHPFAKSIQTQYRQRRELLFLNPKTLPRFELMTITAVQSIAGTPTKFATWFDALDYMRDQISKVAFDVAIIGAGAYGLPLGAFVKAQGRQAVHLGGATQLLFGIRGRRWEERDDYRELMNESWVRPLPEETPEASGSVEEACYW